MMKMMMNARSLMVVVRVIKMVVKMDISHARVRVRVCARVCARVCVRVCGGRGPKQNKKKIKRPKNLKGGQKMVEDLLSHQRPVKALPC